MAKTAQNREGKAIQIYLEEGLHARLVALAAGNDRSLSAEVRRALVRHLEAEAAGEAPLRGRKARKGA